MKLREELTWGEAEELMDKVINKRRNKMKITYILMRFYGGGGLATSEIVKCEEDDLFDKCAEFEKECGRQNLGTHIGILDLDEFNTIQREI